MASKHTFTLIKINRLFRMPLRTAYCSCGSLCGTYTDPAALANCMVRHFEFVAAENA